MMDGRRWRGLGAGLLAAAVTTLVAGEARAQTPAAPRPIAVEGIVGWAGFVDDATDHHALVGGALRLPIGRRLSVGPEVFLASGSQDDDAFVLGSVWVDLGPAPERARVVPYLVAGGGYMRHSQRFLGLTVTSGEGSFTAGGGVRAQVADRFYVGAEARLGWELHVRVAGVVGVTWPRR